MTSSMPDQPLVSVIIPTYKRPMLLGQAIASVMAQRYPSWELLVVDDNDENTPYRANTERFMARYAADARIHYLKHQKNSGLPAARNTGIRQASGLYVAFLDDDDAWEADKLEKQVALFTRGGDKLALVYTGLRVVNGQSETQRVVTPSERGNIFAQLLRRNCVDTPSSVMCTKEALLEVGLFDESLPSAEDLDLYLRLAKRYQADFIAEPLTIYVKHEHGRMMQNYRNVIRAREMLYAKHYADLVRDRRVHSHFVHRQGYYLMRNGNIRQARHKFLKALWLNPLNHKPRKALLRTLIQLSATSALPSK